MHARRALHLKVIAHPGAMHAWRALHRAGGAFRFMIDKIGKFRCVITGFCNMK
jgi:hypothetical protein